MLLYISYYIIIQYIITYYYYYISLLSLYSIKSFDNILLHFAFTWCLSSPFSDVTSFIIQSCLTFLLDVSSYNFWASALSEHFKILRLLILHSL